jgi:hypothetical protein
MDQKLDKTCHKHLKTENYKKEQATKLRQEIDQLREGRSQKFLMVKNLQQDYDQKQRAKLR